MSSRLVWYTEQVPGWPWLYREPLVQKKKNQGKENEVNLSIRLPEERMEERAPSYSFQLDS